MESGWERQHYFTARTAKIAAAGGIALVSLSAVMAVTNPGDDAYEGYATQALITYADQKICSKAPAVFGVRDECRSMLKSNRSQVTKLIADGTHHQNFVFFSIYTTNLSVAAFLPSYRVQTIGVFNQFFIYETTRE